MELAGKIIEFGIGALAVFLIAGLTCIGALAAIAAVIGERDGEGA